MACLRQLFHPSRCLSRLYSRQRLRWSPFRGQICRFAKLGSDLAPVRWSKIILRGPVNQITLQPDGNGLAIVLCGDAELRREYEEAQPPWRDRALERSRIASIGGRGGGIWPLPNALAATMKGHDRLDQIALVRTRGRLLFDP